jgi:hypothetical protein
VRHHVCPDPAHAIDRGELDGFETRVLRAPEVSALTIPGAAAEASPGGHVSAAFGVALREA